MGADGTDRPGSDRPGTDRPEVTVEDLKRWQDHGATWRPLEISDQLAVVELCTCYGEPVDTVLGTAPALIEFVRSHHRSE